MAVNSKQCGRKKIALTLMVWDNNTPFHQFSCKKSTHGLLWVKLRGATTFSWICTFPWA